MMEYKFVFCVGLLLVCQQIYCNEISTPSSANTNNNNDDDDGGGDVKELLTTLSIAESQNLTTLSDNVATQTRTSITRLHPVTVFNKNASTTEESVQTTTPQFDDTTVCDDTDDHNYLIESIAGDVVVSIILHQSDNATAIIRFIVNRINEIDLLAHNISIGVRIVQIKKPQNFHEILENELEYLEHCVSNPFGIFLSSVYWHNASASGKNQELKMWSLPDVEQIKIEKLGHLLNEVPLPADSRNASVELRSDSMNRTKHFQNIMKAENLCLKSFPSDKNIFIYMGNAEYLNSVHFSSSHNLIIVPLTTENLTLADIPNNSFIAFESEMELNHDKNSTFSPSEFTALASTFYEICKSINNAIWKISNHSAPTAKINLTKCEICNDLEVPEEISPTNFIRMLKLLQLETLENQMNYNLFQKFTSTVNETNHSIELKKVATTNFITNVTTVFVANEQETLSLGSLFKCEDHSISYQSSHLNDSQHGLDMFKPDEIYPPKIRDEELEIDHADEIYWELKSELWVAVGLTMSTLGILLCMAILTFILIRICMDDVLEGNPIGSVLLLIALIAQFVSFFPFTLDYVSSDLYENTEVLNSMCVIKIFFVTVCYCLTFALLLSRAIMLASIGSEGGFLSHVNGYIQSIICVFSFLVQLGLSTQLLIMMHANSKHVTCLDILNGKWFWGVIGYDGFLLVLLVLLSPLIFKSQRNYQEGILIVITSVLCLICWMIWIPLSLIDDHYREIMIGLGVQTTAWIILSALLVPRCFLIVKSIARSDFTQALPSLTSLAFAQANQFISEPSIYECVNQGMRGRSSEDDTDQTHIPNEYQSPSEVPTLPLRSEIGRRNFIEHYNLNFNEIINDDLPSPNKMTRF